MEQTNIPKGKIKRSSVIGITTAKAGLKKLEYVSKLPFIDGDKKEELRESNNDEIAKIIFSAIGMLKGAPVKLAQMFSMETERLPETYQKELIKSANQVPPISRGLIRNIIKRELGEWPENIFSSFESTPFAAASIGQVHRAESLKGKKIAVKVQYPGIAESIKSDVQMLRNILRITPFSWIIDGALTEIEEGLAEELDYRLEADNTDFFYNNLCMDNIIIPEVYREYSSERVLATSFIDGEKLDGWLYRSPDRDKRSYYGQLLCDLFISSIKGNFLIHADPNIGNFLFRDDGRLGLIDFGCVKKLSPDFIDKGNFNNAEELFRLSGIKCKKSETDRESYKFFTSWIEYITRPVRSEYFDFAENTDYFNEMKIYIPEIYNYIESYHGGFMYFGRTMYGLYRLLHRLGARVSLKLL